MSDDDEQVGGWDLVLPFVACTDHGGPYDPDSFAAGWAAGQLDLALAAAAELGGSFDRYVRPALVPQIDLIAMRRGYTMRAEPWNEEPEWVRVQLHPAVDADGDVE
jgi:hypothetical protein